MINLKLVLKQVPVLLEDRDKNVREEGKKLVVELYRWIGQALKPQLSALKPIQVDRLFLFVQQSPNNLLICRFRSWKQNLRSWATKSLSKPDFSVPNRISKPKWKPGWPKEAMEKPVFI